MNQDIAVNRIIRDMKLAELLTDDNCGEARIYLNALWVAAWEARGKVLADQRSLSIQQFTSDGKFLEEYHNILIAAHKAKYSRGTIYTSLNSGEPTRRGHIWKYKIITGIK